MPKLARLYLDTARLGLMSPSAQLAARDFARLAGEGLSTLYSRKLMHGGYRALVRTSASRFTGIADWPGIGGLSSLFRAMVNVPAISPVLFASRSTALMRFAARQMWAKCRRILVPDTAWPPYVRVLNQERLGSGRQVIPLPIREATIRDHLDIEDLVAEIATAYHQHNCDGLLLAAISHDGIQLPVERLLELIRSRSTVNLSIIDGAQSLAHVPIDLAATRCDIFLAGCHKWLGAYQPLGIGVFANPPTARHLQEALVSSCREAQDDDPLLRFVMPLQGQPAGDGLETVNLTPLFSAWGALRQMDLSSEGQRRRLITRQQNAERLADASSGSGWQPRLSHPSLRTGILLLETRAPSVCRLAPTATEHAFAAQGIALSCLEPGLIRLALPAHELGKAAWRQMALALAGVVKNRIPRQPLQPPPVSCSG